MNEEPVQLSDLKDPALDFAFKRRAEIKAQQDSLEAEAKALNALVMGILMKRELKTVVSAVGSYTYSHTRRSSFSKDTMKKELLKRAVSAAVVKECIDASTSFTEYDSVTFRVPGEKG